MITAFEQLYQVEDPRSARNQLHSWEMLIGTSMLAALCGIDQYTEMAEFTELHMGELEAYYTFPHGAPSHDTYRNLWNAINPEQFYHSFELFTASLTQIKQGVISIDGKTIRNSGSSNPLQIVSAWCGANQLVLAQYKVDKKSNEITAIPELLRLLDLKDRIVTIDAIGTQRDICTQIIEQSGDYVLALKGNQANLLEAVTPYFANHELAKCDHFTEHDKGHGRIERRAVYATSNIDWLITESKWPGLRSIGMVTSQVTKGEKTTQETRYFISSLPADARFLCHTVRAHWGIENKLHWRLDVVFNEDKSCIRNDNAAENMNILRKWVLNALQGAKDKPDRSTKSLMRRNSMSFKHLLSCVNKIFHA